MNSFSSPLPVPANAIRLTEREKALLQKYYQRIEAAQRQIDIAKESMSDIGMSIAARAGQAATAYELSADFGCLIPREDPNAVRRTPTAIRGASASTEPSGQAEFTAAAATA